MAVLLVLFYFTSTAIISITAAAVLLPLPTTGITVIYIEVLLLITLFCGT